ncbi:MAG: divalent-cation tolerance protein CutA [Thaumarchaeota archaeon]|nr:divalent-cation tolerance protein CutA [Nitrososphaerota archaeon]
MIVSTYPDKKSLDKITNIVIKKRLAACVNYTKINSVYTWKGKVENTCEFLTLFKTTTKAKKLLKEEIARTHPYEVPEIAELKMDSINALYHNWLMDSTGKGKPKKRNNPSKRRHPQAYISS